jgi:hypothetical protein
MGGTQYEALSEAFKRDGEAAVSRFCEAERPAMALPRPDLMLHAMSQDYGFL